MKIEFTEDFLTYKKGDVVERSRDIALLHIKVTKNAKPYVEKKKPVAKKKPKQDK